MANFLGITALSVPAGFVGATGEANVGEEVEERGVPVGMMGDG